MKAIFYLFNIIILLLCFINLNGQDLKLASIFGDNMVIQQGINAPVWGWSGPGSRLKIEFAGTESYAITDESGRWMTRMPVLNAGGPYKMKITGPDDTITFSNVMTGEVWLASGQSNMEWTMGSGVGPNTNADIAEANYPEIRFYNVPKKTSSVPVRDTEKQNWTICSPETVKSLSAVSYFFARELCKHKNVAVGIISSSWGATSAEAWISSEMLATHPDFRERVLSMDTDTAKWNSYVRNCLKAEQDRETIARTSRIGIEEGVMDPGYDDSG